MTEKVDYLEVDDPIPGQNFCMSFIFISEVFDSR